MIGVGTVPGMTRARTLTAAAGLLLALAGCGGTDHSSSTTPPAAAPTVTPKPSRTPSPSDIEVEKYQDVNCENWPKQPADIRTAAARAALDWLRKHPSVLGPEVGAPTPTARQVASFASAITTECAGRQHGSNLVQLVAAATIIYNEHPEYSPPAG